MKISDLKHRTIIISRTDSIGDVCLTLPLCAYLKEQIEGVRIVFLGNNYTRPVIECCEAVDEILDWSEISQRDKKEQVAILKKLGAAAIFHIFPRKEIASIAKKAKIPFRVGTSHRFFHLFTCNCRVDFTRKNSDLHESQLNFKLLQPLKFSAAPITLSEMNQLIQFSPRYRLTANFEKLLDFKGKKVILHPKSQGSAVEWGVEKFVELSLLLVEKGYRVYFSGTEKEGLLFRESIPKHENIIDITGKMNLGEFIAFINQVDVLVAASTGPLHIAGLLNKRAIGLFSPRKPIHPGRWQPIGNKSTTIVFDEDCDNCKKGEKCDCISKIAPEKVLEKL